MQKYAVQEMQRAGVPASITLAQGILETAAGTSALYTRSYNNFGIKCKSNWSGPFTYHDDDAKGECFRVYDNDSMSYVDHSNFLRTASRYNSLFQLPTTDYKGWAYGLKKAGYATNPKYSVKLIEYIEKYNLSQFDAMDATASKKWSQENTTAMVAAPKVNLTPVTTSSPAERINLPAPPATNDGGPATAAIDPDNIQIVHWNVTNVADATPGYTVTPAKNNKAYKYYKKGQIHNISYGKKPVAQKTALAKNTKVAAKTPVKKSTAVAKTPVKKAAPAKATATTTTKNNRSTRL